MITTKKTPIPRRSIKVTKKELAVWKTEFADYGAKVAAERVTGVPVQTIRNIVNRGRGILEYVQKLREYIAIIKAPETEVKTLVLTPNAA